MQPTSEATGRGASGSDRVVGASPRTVGSPLARAVGLTLRRSAVHAGAEWRTLVWAPPARSRLRRPVPVLGLAGCALVLAAAWLQRVHPVLGRLVLGEQASLWWPVAFLRLPGSMFAPALRLPMWGALAQVLFCFGLAETHLGRRATLAVIGLTNTAATLTGRAFIALGPHAPLHLGLPRWVRFQRDTGPSAAVVGLGTYLGVTLRLPILTTLLVGAMTIEAFIKPDLADREHLVAIAVGGMAAIAVRVVQSTQRRTPIVAVA